MKKAIFTILIAVSFLAGNAQLYNSGGNITVASGATLVVQGDYTSTGTGNIDIDGIVDLKGNFINNNSSGGIDPTSTGTLNFSGTSAQQISGARSTSFYGTLNINNSAGVALTTLSTGAHQTINGLLNFNAGKLTLNGFNLTISTIDPTGFDADEYIVTNGSGMVYRTVEGSDVIYPVGNSAFNPVTLANNGLSDSYGVKVNDGTPSGWTGGNNHVVNRYWQVAEIVEGGSDLSVTPQWNSGEEQAGFDRTDAAVGLTRDDGATFTWAASGASTGTDPYTRSGSNFTGPGTFMVGDYFYEGLEFSGDIFLAGPYNASTGKMNTLLRQYNWIPSTDPYGLGTVSTSIPANAVDWVKIQLRAVGSGGSIGPVAYEFAKFLDENGNLMNEDGSYPVEIKGVTKGSYFVAIRHRNHLGIVSAVPLDLNPGSATYDFTTAQSMAWQNTLITRNPAMRQLDVSKFGLFEGDITGNGTITLAGGLSDKQVLLNLFAGNYALPITGYYNEDVNLDRRVTLAGGIQDKVLLLNVFEGNYASPIRQHLP